MAHRGAFADRTVLVTGCATGIGRAAAKRFAVAGARLVLADIAEAAGEALASELRQAGSEPMFIPTDVGDSSSVNKLFERIGSAVGSLDVAFNNAGIEAPSATIADTDEADWERVIRVNLTGVYLCMRSELRMMLAKGRGGYIVNTASIGALVATPLNASYAAAKAGIIGLTRTAAIDHAKDGIRINALCPGLTDTPMVERMTLRVSPEHRAALVPPLGRLGTPDEVAAAAVWMCSSDASFMTGQTLSIDGGYTAV